MEGRYKLTYYDARGRGEVTRWLLALGNIPYEDRRIPHDEWKQQKEGLDLPNGQIPTLEMDGTVYCQSRAINRYLAKHLGIAGKSSLDQLRADMIVDTLYDFTMPVVEWFYAEQKEKERILRKLKEEQVPEYLKNLEKMLIDNNGGDGYFVGDEMTWADLFFADNISWLDLVGISVDWSIYPKLAALKETVLRHPKISEWIKNRPDSDF